MYISFIINYAQYMSVKYNWINLIIYCSCLNIWIIVLVSVFFSFFFYLLTISYIAFVVWFRLMNQKNCTFKWNTFLFVQFVVSGFVAIAAHKRSSTSLVSKFSYFLYILLFLNSLHSVHTWCVQIFTAFGTLSEDSINRLQDFRSSNVSWKPENAFFL